MSSKRDYYEILGISKNATQDEIKKAYRKLAKQYHPDTPTGNESKFKEISEAYEVLGDHNKKQQYDNFGHNFSNNGFGGSGNFSDMFSNFSDIFSGSGFNDIFSNMFSNGQSSFRNSQYQNRPLKGESILLNVTLTMKEYIFGKQFKQILKIYKNCKSCNGTGALNNKDIVKCTNCNGHGIKNQIRNTPFGQVQTQTMCSNCNGRGTKILNSCRNCKGAKVIIEKNNFEFKIPPSSPLGQKILYPEVGHTGLNGGKNGDIIISCNVLSDKYFQIINNFDLYLELPVNYLDLLLGENIQIPTFDGIKKHKLSPNTENNEKIILSNCGLFKNRSSRRGDLIVKLIASFPKKVSSNDKKLLNQLKENSNFNIDINKFIR